MDSHKLLLVPVDFSDHSKEALNYAANLAVKMSLDILVLHVVHDPLDAPGFYAPKGHKKSLRKLKELAEERMGSFMAAFQENNSNLQCIEKWKTMLVCGLPVTRILEVVKSCDPFMVVMGSEGRTGLANIMLGSKAEQLVRLCPAPVTIIKKLESK